MPAVTPLAPDALEAMLRTGTSRAFGTEQPVHSAINRAFAAALQGHVRAARPRHALETGLAFGGSALAILGGSEDLELVSVDPLQQSLFEGRGTQVVVEAGLGARHRVVERPSHLALPQLLDEGLRIQLAYIDGWHTFDGALLDFLYADRMLDVGGVIAFNDCWLPAVHKTIGFVRTHRDYEELAVGLPRTFTGANRLDALRRRAEGRRQEDRYFAKRSDHEPAWDFFRRF